MPVGSYGQKNGISVMAALICILLKMLKGSRVASSGFLISTLHRYKNCKTGEERLRYLRIYTHYIIFLI